MSDRESRFGGRGEGMPDGSPRVAIVHDWLVTYAGAERVLAEMLRVLPGAELFAVVDFLPESERDFLEGRAVSTSFIQRLPAAQKRYRQYLPLMGVAIEQLDVSSFDLVVWYTWPSSMFTCQAWPLLSASVVDDQ